MALCPGGWGRLLPGALQVLIPLGSRVSLAGSKLWAGCTLSEWDIVFLAQRGKVETMVQTHKLSIVSRKNSRITHASLVLEGSLSSPAVSASIFKEGASLKQKSDGFRGGARF